MRVRTDHSTSGRSVALGGASAPSFTSTQFDYPGPKPSFGVAGYVKDGGSVIVSERSREIDPALELDPIN